MNDSLIVAIAALIGLPLAFAQWRSGRVQARSAEVDLLREMRADWLGLKTQWHRALLTALGPDSYYSPANLEDRQTFRQLITDIYAEPDTMSDVWHVWHQSIRDRSHEFEQAERDILFFLATLASVVFRGDLSPTLAYTVVGPDVVRRSRQIRVLLGQAEARWTVETVEEMSSEGEDPECPWGYWVDSLPGLTDRIFGLLDVLWAEGARLYDLETHDLVAAAMLKRQSGSGVRNRLRIRRLAREHGSRIASWRLERKLLNAEFLSIGPPRTIRFMELELVPPLVQGWGTRGRLRRNLAFTAGRLRRAQRRVQLALPVE